MSKVTHQETKYATDVILVCDKHNKAKNVICDKHNKVTNVICDKHNEATNVICDTHNKQHKKMRKLSVKNHLDIFFVTLYE